MRELFRTLNFILKHPLNKRNQAGALWRWLHWQVSSRLHHGSVEIPFFNHSKLLVSPGMTGATGNIYCGLHEFEPMGLLIHLLRAGDTFVDVGANVGSYSILCASLGAECIAFEPIAGTFQNLKNNIKLNHYESRITAHQTAISDRRKYVNMTQHMDTMNRICGSASEQGHNTIQILTETLDQALPRVQPIAIKIDVEGAESQVIQGGKKLFQIKSLSAVILEVNDEPTHYLMCQIGFCHYDYDPFERKLSKSKSLPRKNSTGLYLRNLPMVHDRIRNAPKYKIFGQQL